MYTSEEIDRIVTEYQGGGDSSELVDAFKPYLTKWLSVVKCRHISILDPEVASFVSLFCFSNMHIFRDRFYSHFGRMDDRDIYGELVVMFLDTASRYVDMGKHFTNYLKGSFRYTLHRWVISEFRQPHIILNENMDGVIDPGPATPDNIMLIEPDIISNLLPRERRILYMRYMEDRSAREIGEIFSITPTQVYRIINAAKDKLRSRLDQEPNPD